MEKSNYKNFIEVLNEVSEKIILNLDATSGKNQQAQIFKINTLYQFIKGHLKDDTNAEAVANPKTPEDALKLFGAIHQDKNIIKLKQKHAGITYLNNMELGESEED